MSTDNMRVINKEYDEWDRVQTNPDGLIMSDDLREMMGITSDDGSASPPSFEHQLSIILDAPDCATISGNLHTLQFMGSQSISFEIEKCSSEMLQTLYSAAGKGRTANITLKGDNGFEAQDSKISSFGLVKMAPHTFLLTITFESNHVIF